MTVEEKRKQQEGLTHVHYEMWMVARLALEINKHQVPVNNAIVESLVLHLDNIAWFLAGKGQGDDILASHYGHTSELDLETCRSTRQRRNKEIAHLTHSRKLEPGDRVWDFDKLIRDVAPSACAFIEHLLEENCVDQSARQDWKELREAYARISATSIPSRPGPSLDVPKAEA